MPNQPTSNLFKIRGFTPYLVIAFLNAFTDLGHKIIIQNIVFKHYDGTTQIVLTAIVNALILLPFVALFTPTGYVADKYPKDLVIKISAAAAIPVTALITLCYYQGWFEFAFILTLVLGIQAAFYSPAKYGYIKELVGKENLAMANAYVQGITIVSILAGTFVFSIFFESYLSAAFGDGAKLGEADGHSISGILQTIAPLGFALVACSSLETLFALRLPNKGATNTAMKFDVKHYVTFQYLRENLASIRRTEVIWLSIIGLSIFWGVNQVLLAAFPEYLKHTLGETNTIVSNGLMGLGGVGIVVGSLFAGKVSKNFIETGILPIGAFGMSISLLVLPSLTNLYLIGGLFFFYGVMGGLFIIPLNALVQFNAGAGDEGKVLAGNNFMQNAVMFLFLMVEVAFVSTNTIEGMPFKIDSTVIFYFLFAVAFIGSVFTLSKLPQAFIRYAVTFLLTRRYILSVQGMKNIPASGGVLLVGNHSSWLDWAILQIACPRPVRFVMFRAFYKKWYLKKFLDLFGVIPISTAGSADSLRAIQEQLSKGEVVALFPEGRISKNGQLAEFQRGFELAAKGVENLVIVPFYLRGLWGSFYSYATKKLQANSKRKFVRDITVTFGKPMDSTSDTRFGKLNLAAEVKQEVLTLSIASWHAYAETLEPVHIAWLHTAKKMGGALSLANFDGTELSHTRLLTAAIAFSKRIKALTVGEQNVGILLPASSGGVLANLGVLMNGKTVVNLNYTASKEALQHALNAANIKTVLTSAQFLKKLEGRGINLSELLSQVKVINLEELREKISKVELLMTLLQVKLFPTGLLRALYFKRPKLGDTAAILFSSGSEGLPKGVELSHRNLIGNIKQVISVLNPPDEEVVLSSLPIFHAFGLTVTTLMPLVEGLTMVCQPDPTDAVSVGKMVAKYKVSLMCGTSSFLGLYARNNKLHPLMFETIRMVVAGAERLNEQVREAFKDKFGITIYEGYGTTETTPVAGCNVPDALSTFDWSIQIGNKQGTVGLPLPGTAFKIVAPDSMEELPIGGAGLILIGGPQLMKGYLNDEKKTATAFVELDGIRWYKTGDKGVIDEDGFLKILDRYSRFSKIGGEMVSLSAVEDEVRKCLSDKATEIIAVGIPDAAKGEKIVLLVAGDEDAAALRQRLVEGGVNALMIPKQVLRVDTIPKLGTGKTDFATAKKFALEAIGGVPEAVQA